MILILSAALTIWSAITLWLVGSPRHARIGFLSGIAAQGLWIAFDLITGAYGLLPLALVYGPLYWRGYRKYEKAGTCRNDRNDGRRGTRRTGGSDHASRRC